MCGSGRVEVRTCEGMQSRAIREDGKDQGCWGKWGISVRVGGEDQN